MRRLKVIYTLVSITFAICFAREAVAGKCTGGDPCYACTNCSRCGHCKGGGSCGACRQRSNVPLSPRRSAMPEMPVGNGPVCSASRSLAKPPPASLTPPKSSEASASPLTFPGSARLDKPARTEARTKVRTRVASRSDEDWEVHIREWKNKADDVVATGRYMSAVGDYLWVKTRDGQRVKLSLDELSDDDLKYLDSRAWARSASVTASR